MTIKEYDRLSEKHSNGTITKAEKKRFFIAAFGEDFVASDNKGEKVKYSN
tara:strand:+ start:4581 stop:4730 length:150 start_codon:yes stop_codon:yes gene_type:complete